MSFRIHTESNITHVRGLYSIDESIPISKFIYEKDRSYLQNYRKKKMANQIRRCCSSCMNVFDPVYYPRMIEYKLIQQRPYSINVERISRNYNNLDYTYNSDYPNSKKNYPDGKTKNHNSLSSVYPQIRKGSSYKQERIKIENLLLKKYYQKWYFKWCSKNSMRMSKIKSHY